MAEPNIKNLPPEERIKRLKKLEEERKKEIEDAHRQIKESENELTERRKWVEKVPIPQSIQEDTQGLSESGKDILKTQKGIQEKKKEEPPAEKKSSKKQELSLEETISREDPSPLPARGNIEYGGAALNPSMPPQMSYGAGNTQSAGVEYRPFREQSMKELYGAMSQLKNSIEDKGYISGADERKAEYLTGIVQERLEAGREGRYASFTEEVARMGSLAQQLGANITNAYKSRSGNPMYKA